MSTDPGVGRFVRAVEEQGISLLEVLISIVLILLTVPFLAAMEVSALKMNGDAGEIDNQTKIKHTIVNPCIQSHNHTIIHTIQPYSNKM